MNPLARERRSRDARPPAPARNETKAETDREPVRNGRPLAVQSRTLRQRSVFDARRLPRLVSFPARTIRSSLSRSVQLLLRDSWTQGHAMVGRSGFRRVSGRHVPNRRLPRVLQPNGRCLFPRRPLRSAYGTDAPSSVQFTIPRRSNDFPWGAGPSETPVRNARSHLGGPFRRQAEAEDERRNPRTPPCRADSPVGFGGLLQLAFRRAFRRSRTRIRHARIHSRIRTRRHLAHAQSDRRP